MNLWIVEWLGDGLWEKLPQPHLDIINSWKFFSNSEQCKSQLERFLATQRARESVSQLLAAAFGGGCILARWLNIPQCQGAWGRSIGYRKIHTRMTRRKCCEFSYPTQSKGWLFWRTNTIVELLNLKLQSGRFIFLTVCLRRTPPGRDPLGAGELVKVRSLLKNGCLWLCIKNIIAVVS